MPRPEIVVIGGSAGAIVPLSHILAGLPKEFRGSVFVVIHTSPDGSGGLPEVLGRQTSLPVIFPSDGERIQAGFVYVAPPNYHLLVEKDRIRVSGSARENGFRPAVDPLFRSAAKSYDGRTVGIILSGALDDGTFGLSFLKQSGGTAIVQHPDEAVINSMPLSALQNVEVDHIAKTNELAPLLVQLFDGRDLPEKPGVTKNPEPKATSRLDQLITVHGPDKLGGSPSVFSCPGCGGVMWEVAEGGLSRFRCHTGHGFTPEILLNEQNGKLEAALWSAVRLLRERAALHRQLAAKISQRSLQNLAERYLSKAAEEDAKSNEIEAILGTTMHSPREPGVSHTSIVGSAAETS